MSKALLIITGAHIDKENGNVYYTDTFGNKYSKEEILKQMESEVSIENGYGQKFSLKDFTVMDHILKEAEKRDRDNKDIIIDRFIYLSKDGRCEGAVGVDGKRYTREDLEDLVIKGYRLLSKMFIPISLEVADMSNLNPYKQIDK